MKRWVAVTALVLGTGIMGILSWRGVTSASTTVQVRPSAMNGWGFLQETATGSGSMVSGPLTPPAGVGSAELVTNATGGVLIGRAWPATRLDDISDIRYSTHQPLGTGPAFAAAFQFNVDYDLTDAGFGFQGRLVFEPYLNGTITHGVWETWTPLSGEWWATGGLGAGVCTPASPCDVATLLTNWPDIGIHSTFGAVLLKAGGSWSPGFTGNVDALTITTDVTDTLFDFEPDIPCTTVCYVDDATGNDAGGGDTPSTAKKTIQAAVTQVTAGGTVHVAAGTYEENVVVSKAMLISGAGPTTIVQPALSFPGPGCGSSLCAGHSSVFLLSASDITIEELTVDGDNPSLTSGVFTGGVDVDARNGIIEDFNAGVFDNLEVRDVTVQNIYLRGVYASSGGTGFHIHDNTVDNVAGEVASIAIFNFGGSGVIEDNVVSDANDAIASNWSTGTQYLNNTVTNSGSGVHSDNNGGFGGTGDLLQGNDVSNCAADGYGVWTFAPFVDLTVDSNTVTNCAVGLAASGENLPGPNTTLFTDNVIDGVGLAGSTGAYVTTDRFGFGSTDVHATFTGNVIKNNDDGFEIEAQPGFTAEVAAHFNEISGNSVSGATATGTGTFDADLTANWWGSDTGAAHTGNVGGTANLVTDNVYYSPWLGFGDASGAAGFQTASPMTWFVNPNGCKVTCIQRAVDFSANGDTIKSKTGVFSEHVIINKDVTVMEASTPVIDGGGTGDVVTITADGATLDGYEVRNGVNGVVIASGADSVTVTDNNIHTFTSAGLRATTSTGDDLSSNVITGPHTGLPCGPGFWGMFLTDTSGTVDLNTISGIGNGLLSGCQAGRAIEATGTGTLQITNNDISQYQKSGIIVRDTVNTTITNNTTAGEGPTAAIAMNGITVTSSGTTMIDGNHTSGHRYTPESDVSCGILAFNTTVSITGNDSTADEVGICALGGDGTSVTLNEIDQHTQQGMLIDGALNIIVDDNDIDGAGAGTTASAGVDPDTDTRYYGLFIVGSTGTISNNDITGITHGVGSGTQSGVGIRVTARPGETSDVDITGNVLTNYQKNGFVITNVYGGVSVNADLVGNTVTGAGPVNYIAQNGIQFSGNATGSVTGNNNVSGHDYTPFTAAAVGVLLFDAGTVNVNGNQIHDNMEGVYVQDSDNASVDGNVFTNNYDTSIFVYLSDNGGYHFNTFNGQPGSYGMWLYDDSLNNEIQSNDFLGHEVGIVVEYGGPGNPLGTDISGNNFVGNSTFGVQQMGTLVGPVVDAEDNWWNACNGPGPVGPGGGDNVSTNVDFTPFEHGACDSDFDLLTDDAEGLIYFTDYLDPDTDGDGCSDGEEILFPIPFGGGRNPLFPWDFYDVNGSKKVDAADIGLVRGHFNPIGPVPLVDQIYDRSNGVAPHAPGAPNNRINAIDIALVRWAFNHNCQDPPP